MTSPVQVESRVGPDGVLTVRIPLGPEDAHSRVRVTVEPLPQGATGHVEPDWSRFVDETYGSCASFGLERQPQGDFETREAIE
jgi:hypothetical protein